MTESADRVAWRDPVRWSALCDGTACPIGNEGPLDIVGQLSASWVTAGPKAALPGYVTVVAKRHVVEPFQLPRRERARFWEDVTVAARTLADLFHPIKMNYEIHGNTIPHLHAHLYPRSVDDPFVGGPIDPRIAFFTRSPEDLSRIRRAFQGVSKARGRPRQPDRDDHRRGSG